MMFVFNGIISLLFYLQRCKMVFNGNGWCSYLYWGKNNPECPFACWENWEAIRIGYRWNMVCPSWIFPWDIYLQNKVKALIHQYLMWNHIYFIKVLQIFVCFDWNACMLKLLCSWFFFIARISLVHIRI